MKSNPVTLVVVLVVFTTATGCIDQTKPIPTLTGAIQLTDVSDFPKPAISISSPSHQAQVSGTIRVEAVLNEPIALQFYSVNLEVDHVSAGSLTTPPYQFVMNTHFLPPGPHTVEMVVKNVAGLLVESHSIEIDVRNTTSTPEPKVQVSTDQSLPLQISQAGDFLFIEGTGMNNNLSIIQTGDDLTIQVNGDSQTFSGPFTQVSIHAGTGNDLIHIDSSVTANTMIYGGTGADTINALGTGETSIIDLDVSGNQVFTGNGTSTHFWVNSSNSQNQVNASHSEITSGRVNSFSSFYQPWTTNPSDPHYVTMDLDGKLLKNPIDMNPYTITNLSDRPLFGFAPVMDDVNQGYVGDCYFLSAIASLARQYEVGLIQRSVGESVSNPVFNRLRSMVTDLGDGTYAVRFQKNGTPVYVRVDGRFSSSYAYPGSSGDLWAMVMEKAYAYFRYGLNSYDSLNGGWMGSSWTELGIENTTDWVGNWSTSAVYSKISTALSENRGVTVPTNGDVVANAPLIGGHAYSVIGTSKDIRGNISYILRNPWGYDGAGNDANSGDGLVSLTAEQLRANSDWIVTTTY
jgi:hypothetical protein